MRRNWCLVALALVTWTNCHLATANLQDDSDLVFDDEDSDLTELLKPHSVVRREAPASIDSSALHPHSAMKKAHPGSKLAAHGLWKKHPKSSAKHKTKKLGSVAALMAPPTVKKGKSHSTKPLKSARNLLKQLWASNDEYDYDDEDDYVKNDDILSEASGSGSSPLDVDSDDDNDDDGDVIESSGHSCDGGDCEPDELNEKKTDASEGGDSSAQPEGPLKVHRCTIQVQEAFTDTLKDRYSEDFEALSSRLVDDVENIYTETPGIQTASILKFERTDPAGFSYVKVQLDVTTQAFYDTDTICDTLKDTVSSGLMGTFFVTDEGFSCRPVEESKTQTSCPFGMVKCLNGSSSECFSLTERCDGKEDCLDGSDELGCSLCPDDAKRCDGVVDCDDGSDEDNCPCFNDPPVLKSNNPWLLDENGHMMVDEHETIKLHCDVNVSIPNINVTYSFFHMSAEDESIIRIEADPAKQNPHMIASNDTLTLSSLHRRMTGFYMCAVACSYGYGSESSPIQISVNKVMSPPPVRVELVTALEDVAEGKDYELRCVTLAKKDDGKLPRLERLFWGYNGLDEIPTYGPHSRIETLISDDQIVSTLKMINVEAKSRPGVYSCEMIFVNGASEDRTEIPEPPPIREECSQDQFECNDLSCISIDQVCNQVNDCADGEDEVNCVTKCEAGEFQCRDNSCVAITHRCDGKADCRDGSDEHGCPCNSNEWQCDYGTCISRDLRCNGVPDCPDDLSDERDCPAECRGDQFRCNDGTCIERHSRCDRKLHCADGSDEENCDHDRNVATTTEPSTTTSESLNLVDPAEFFCGDGTRIPKEFRCDNIPDCGDASDEDNCQCASDEFRCNDGTCLDIRRRCDGFSDCREREDETNCTSCLSDQFRCRSGLCIPASQECDSIVDCPDRDDETDCGRFYPPVPPTVPTTTAPTTAAPTTTARTTTARTTAAPTTRAPTTPAYFYPPECNEYEFRCNDGTCIDSRRKCDKRLDCPDSSDEDNCDCRRDEFKCGTGQCISSHQRCNRVYDCPDFSDEINCGISCRAGEFACADGNQCVPYGMKCDGRKDCQDFSDEADCLPEPSGEINLKTYPSDQTILQGREVVFQCRDEGPIRAKVVWTRGSGLPLPPGSSDNNGRLEMPNIQPEHAGTYHCEAVGYSSATSGSRVSVYLKVDPFVEPVTRPSTACGVNEATCMNGECIPKSSVCDGDFDCSDGSDEMRCSVQGCEPNEYQCSNKRCVLKTWRCDGDDDCGDNSDEKNCKPSPEDSACRHDEFQCQSQNQCIPRSFHCDMELDCLDRSDEIGCSKPAILIPPVPTITVDISATIVINCTAVGVPTPEVVWRLNWGHVPSKCVMTSENGFGLLTCVDAQIHDQGAYSCEAINAKGSTFAVPDCIVVVRSRDNICIDEEFNSLAKTPSDCELCFCFGHTTECTSSQLFVTQLPLPRDQFQLISIKSESFYQRTLLFTTSEVSRSSANNRPFLKSPNSNDGVQAYRRDSTSSEIAFFNLPPSHRGYQMNSYGGQITFRVVFRGSGTAIQAPTVVLKGNGITLFHTTRQRMEPNQENEVTIRFVPQDWTVGQNKPARRSDLMTVLQSIEYFLIRATYLQSSILDTTISQVRMDTADEFSRNSPPASLVEECRCPAGYMGLSCDKCAPGYTVDPTDQAGRRCIEVRVECDAVREWTCVDGSCIDIRRRCDSYPDCYDGSDEELCPRPPSCDSVYEWTCDDGSCVDIRRRCDGYPDCRDRSDERQCPPKPSQCNAAGIVTGSSTTNGCSCKELVTGAQCDQCKSNSFHLDVANQDGCINCFCMGITKSCTSSSWYRTQERSVFTSGSQEFALTEKAGRSNITERITVNSISREIVYREFDRLPSEAYYWKLPSKFLGDKITSYGGRLNYTVRYVPLPDTGRTSSEKLPDVELRGNGIRLFHYSRESVAPMRPISVSILIRENEWQREDGRSADREHLLMVLADLDRIFIKATYSSRTQEVGLSDVTMDFAQERYTGQVAAVEVEQCSCPIGYKGLSCEDCDVGYTRSVQGVYLGLCEPCECNGHSDQCDPDTGVCLNCRDHTTGEQCEECEAGYTGDATRGTPTDCRQSNRPLGCVCDSRGTLYPGCPDGRSCSCKANCEGPRCDRCRDGTFGLLETNEKGCIECYCSFRTKQCTSANMYRTQISMQVMDSQHGFTINTLLNDDGLPGHWTIGDITQNLRVNVGQNEITYTAYHSSVLASIGAESPNYVWSLPPAFLGNQVLSYGGKLTFTLRIEERQGGFENLMNNVPFQVMMGSGPRYLTFRSKTNTLMRSGESVTMSVPLLESEWDLPEGLLGRGTEVARSLMMDTLANLEYIRIIASYGKRMESTSISNVTMDTSVSFNTGQEQAHLVEECRCPQGYKGTSCEDCASGFYREGENSPCLRCPCGSNAVGCTQSNGAVVCNCRQGFSGRTCDTADTGEPIRQPDQVTITMNITEPRIQIADVGSTVRFYCSAQSLIGRQVLIRWSKEEGSMPSGRAQDDRRGLLIITDVRSSDSGVYMCSALDGITTVTETVILNVGGFVPSAPSVNIEPRYVEATVGQNLDVRCLAEGNPTPVIEWVYPGSNQFSPRFTMSDGVLKISSVRKEDEGEYVCIARNSEGSSSGRLPILVRGGEDQHSDGTVQVSINPPEMTANSGEGIRMTCSANVPGDRNAPTIQWTRSGSSLPVNAQQNNGILAIPSASPADSGIYVCTVTTSSGAFQTSQARVNVLAYRGPPTVRIEPDRQTISQGSDAELRCLAVGDPSPTVRWTKVGEEFGQNILVTGPILRIANAMVRDRGMYICTAENPAGIAQASAIIEVERREAPGVVLYPQASQTVVQGGSALFQCRVTAGIPTPRAKWTRVGGGSMPSNVEELDGGVIRFNKVNGAEAGQYVCTAQNEVGTTTGVAVLNIQSIPVVTITPQGSPIRVRSGQRLRLECGAKGDPTPSVSWKRLRTGFLFDSLEASETQHVAVYEVSRVSQQDEGTYSCTGRNDAGLSEERIQVIVEDHPHRGDIEENNIYDIIEPNEGGSNVQLDDVHRIPVGGTAEMRCQIIGSQQGIYLDWERSDGGDMGITEIIDGVLYIRNVQPSQAGDYSCVGKNRSNERLFSATTRLEVVVPPHIQLQPQHQVVRPGDQVYISCTASGDQPITINWSKINGNLPPAVLVNNGQLQFRGIAVSDAGRYICTASNSVGQAEAVAEVVVNEESSGVITTSDQREQTVFIGSSVDLTCNLPPSVSKEYVRFKWTRDRGSLPPTAFQDTNKLQIVNVQPSDAGRYICEASSAGGVSTEYVLLKVERSPSLNVRVLANREVVHQGDNLEVRCDVSGDPSALISWKRIGGPLSRNIQVLSNLLRIVDVNAENGGVYRCQVLSTAGTFEEDYFLSIRDEPEFVLDAMDKTVETRTAPVQSVVVMECRTDLLQPVKYMWTRRGGIVPKDARVNGSKLTIPEVRAEDAGTYICTARNNIETTEIPTILVVTGVVPYFTQAPISYMQMPTLPDAYQQFDIEISFKPESPDGMILYNGQQAGGSGDFISFGLNKGIPEFRFDVGAGPAIIQGDRPIDMGKWHTIKLSRNKKDGSMVVDGQGPFSGSVTGVFLGLDLLEPLFIGGVPNFRSIHRNAGFSGGFVGCISRLAVGNTEHELVRDATKSRGVTTCETCALNPCQNGGVCQEAYAHHGYSCICPFGFSGLSCDKIGETCYPGACGTGRCVNTASGFDCMCPFGKSGMNCEKDIVIYEPSFSEGSFAAYPGPSKSVLKKMKLTMRIKPHEVRDGLLAYSAQMDDGGDFASLSIKNGRVEFRYDSGSGPAILRSKEEVRAGEWLKVSAERTYREGVLVLNDGAPVLGKSPGSTRGLNLNSRFYIGGWDRQKVELNPLVNVSSSFHGCLSQFELQGEEVDLVNSVIDSANIEDCGGASACERKPCLNGGVCSEYGGMGLGDFTCECEQGFSGKTCEIEADLCQVIHPCQHGGSCVGTHTSYKCNCPLGYGGSNCELSMDIGEDAFFQGDSYVEIDKSLLPHISTNASEVLTLEFSTTDANGILFWNGQKPEMPGHGQDYIALAVVNGRLEFSYELGSGPAQITTRERVNDGKRHQVVARRTTRHGSLELDGIRVTGISPEGNHQMLNTQGNIYIGGLPNSDLMTAGRYLSSFRGCIHKLQIQDSGVLNFNRAAVSAVNIIPCSSFGLLEDDDDEPQAN